MTERPSKAAAPSAPTGLPIAVQVGFGGARRLVPQGLILSGDERIAFEQDVFRQLRDALQSLRQRLGLKEQHFLVGISQIAAGGDQLFSRAIGDLGWGHRVFLPQTRDAYLSASGTAGPDFSAGEAASAREFLSADYVIEEVVVTTAVTRRDRFHETNVAILHEVDALVCLRLGHHESRAGGTVALMDRALKLGRPVLDLVLNVDEGGHPQLTEELHPSRDRSGNAVPAAPTLSDPVLAFLPSMDLPRPVDVASWPNHVAIAKALKAVASEKASGRQARFRWLAAVVVGTHVVATLLALLVMSTGGYLVGGATIVLLGLEVAFLAWGFLTHRWAHRAHEPANWAMTRLCAEVCRSVIAYGNLPGNLHFLLTVHMPEVLRPLLRTFLVLHLRQVRRTPDGQWRDEIARYMKERLTQPRDGQIDYYGDKQRQASRHARVAAAAFTTISMLAILATATKLGLKGWHVHVPGGDEILAFLGVSAVLLPVVTVAILSFSAALDIDARVHTFSQMHEFVQQQCKSLTLVDSAGEAAVKAAHTEWRLLSETVTWHSRRAYTSVA